MKFIFKITLVCLISLISIESFKISNEELKEVTHPAFIQKSTKSSKLRGKKIVFDTTKPPEDISKLNSYPCKCKNKEDEEDPNDCAKQFESSSHPSSSSNSSSSSSGCNCPKYKGTGACSADKKATNALGVLGTEEHTITDSPFKVEHCDQVIVLDGETFIDPKNYSKRKFATFTFSAYMINQFDSRDGKSLQNSILFENITDTPELIHGAPTCLNIQDAKNMNRIVACSKSKPDAEGLREAMLKYMICRSASSLKNVTKEDIQKILKEACSGKRIDHKEDTNEKKVQDFLKPFMPPAINSNEILPEARNKINPGYTLKVPGSGDFIN